MSVKKSFVSLVLAAFMLIPVLGYAQDGGDAPAGGEPAPAEGEAKPAEGEAKPAEATPADGPADEIVGHIRSMTEIVKTNKDAPDTVLKEFKAYVDANGAAMKAAGEAFEKELRKMKPEAAQKYQDRLQRQMEKPLQEFLTEMLEFSKKHPEKARELDEMLQAATMTSK